MSPAQFSTGILSIFDMNSLSRLQSLQISLKYISYFHSLDPKACIFLPQEPATWLLPLCPSSWGCLSFFSNTQIKTRFLSAQRCPPHRPPPLLAISLLLFMVAFPHCGPRMPASHLLNISLHTLFLPGNASSHFFCPASTSSGFKIQVFPLGCFPRSSQGKWIISVTMFTPLLWIVLRLLLGHMWTL